MKVCYTIHFLLLTVSSNVLGNQRDLYIYLPYSPYTVRKLEEKLQSEYKEMKIKIFIKMNDFISEMDNKPEAVLANELLIENFKEYETRLIGKCEGKTDEPYTVIVSRVGSTENIINKNEVDSVFPSTIAMLLIADKAKLTEMVAGFMKPKIVHCEPFAKYEDLVNYYSQGVIIPERLVASYIEKYRKNVVFYKLSNVRLPICALAIRMGEDEHDYIRFIEKLSEEMKKIVGVDKWKKK